MSGHDIIVLDSDEDLHSDDDLNFIITDVKSLANEGQEIKNEGCKQSSSHVQESCAFKQRRTPLKQEAVKQKTSFKQEIHVKQHTGVIPVIEIDLECPNPTSTPVSISAPNTIPSLFNIVNSSSLPAISDASTSSSGLPGEDKTPTGVHIPDILQCIVGWKKIFPWVVFNQFSNKFICSVCRWAYNFSEYYEVYKILNGNDKYSVAGKLRAHTKKNHHEIAVKEQELIMKLCEGVYPLIKDDLHEIRNMESIQRKLSFFSNESPENKSVISLVMQNVALYVEDLHLESLRKSPYFSVISFGSPDYMILRWITPEQKIVEHFFYSQIQNSKEKLPLLAYLQYKGLDMVRMVSFSDLVEPPKEIVKSATKVVNVADRCCPMDTLLEWLKHAEALQDLFLHMEVYAQMCFKFPVLKERRKFFSLKEMYKCLKIEGTVDSMFDSYNILLCTEILKTAPELAITENINFGLLKKTPIIQTVCLLPKLDKILSSYDSPECIEKLKDLRRIISTKREELKYSRTCLNENETASESSEHFLLSIIDMFISQVILTKTTQGGRNFMCLDSLTENMKNLDYFHLENVFYVFMRGLCGGKGVHQLQQLHLELLKKDKNASPLKILARLQLEPSYNSKYPDLLKLGQMVMVLPTLNAHSERYSFDVTVAQAYVRGKVEENLVPVLMYIYLEGPDSVKCLQRDNIFKLFSGK